MQTASDRSRFRRKLLVWFDRNQRDLPWRRRKTPYRIWVSEIMLQQTQVVTVVDYFNRFVKRFPDVQTLAKADESEVLKLWEGLGYYRRARQLHAASRQIVANHAGKFPENAEDVQALPGIGRYTAGAILSIAREQPLPILEGNTIRVHSRILNLRDNVNTSSAQKTLWSFADSIITKTRPGDVNQALMELGSEICTARSPRCIQCPVASHCLAWQQGDPHSLPHKGTQKTRYTELKQVAVIVGRKDRVVIRRCGPGEHWTGLWDFPRFTVQSRIVEREIHDHIQNRTGLTVKVDKPFRRIKHTVTRFRITLDCFQSKSVAGRLRTGNNLRWATLEELEELAMSATGRKIVEGLKTRPIQRIAGKDHGRAE